MVYFTVSEWSLGLLLAVYTEKGLRSIFLADQGKEEELIKALHEKFPKAERAPKGHELYRVTEELIAYVNTPNGIYKGRLDIIGTDFQKEVWKALQEIPVGETMSYSEVAKKLNRPKAYRAVATACGSNWIPLIIPCHRVVGKIGLGGYRYGLPLKEQLLQIESLQVK